MGCAASFNREALQARLRAEDPIFVDEDVRRIEQLKPQLRLPFRLAVPPPLPFGDWSEAERREIESWAAPLQKAGVISDLILIPAMLIDRRQAGKPLAKRIHTAAARFQADAVLLMAMATDVDTYANPLSLLYLTLVGMWVVPGTHHEALTMIEGVLVDNRNGYIYAAAHAEGTGTVCGPLTSVESAGAVRESYLAALQEFGKSFVAQTSRYGMAGSGVRGK
jgi:rhombotail lipoprotein